MEFFLNLHGSASADCDPGRLVRAHAFVEALVEGVMADGGGLVVFLSTEATHPTAGVPLWFDWVVAEHAHRYCAERGVRDRRLRVITGEASPDRRHPQHRRALFEAICRHDSSDVHYLRERTHSGGTYRRLVAAKADAVIALGGGKGVTTLHDEHWEHLPILPMDLDLGAFSADGRGALELREMALVEPHRFFRFAPDRLRSRLRGVALGPESATPQGVAVEALDLLKAELLSRGLARASRSSDPAAVPADRRSFVRRLEDDLHEAVRNLESQRHHLQQWTGDTHEHEGEERLRWHLLTFLKGRRYQASGETDEGGSTDLLVRDDRLGLVWIAECKVHGSYFDLEEGMLQLHTRYASGRHPAVAFVIFCFNKDATAVVSAWKEHLVKRAVCGLAGEPVDDPEQPLAFSTLHRHAASGLDVITRHLVVSLYHKPEDRSGRASRKGGSAALSGHGM